MRAHIALVHAAQVRGACTSPTSEEQLAQYNARTTKRPLLSFAVIAASPIVVELLCRLFGAQ